MFTPETETQRRTHRSRRRGRSLIGLLLAGLTATALVATAPSAAEADSSPPVAGEPETVTADRLPTVQINGVVWDQVIVGDRVYATGQFTQARPAGAAVGQNQTPRSNILAYNLTTGALITTWAPSLNAQGLAIAASADGSRIYVGGDFSTVSGVARSRIVALDATTGAVVQGFSSSASGRVSAIAVQGSTLYLGGNFTNAGGQPRARLAAVNATSGALLPWAPTADRDIVSMTVHPGSGRVIVGGSFTTMNGQSQRGMTSLDGTTGAVMPWAANQVIQNYGANTQISGLTTDGETIFGVAWAYFGAGGTTANFEGQFAADPLTGELRWVNGCRGDQYGLAVTGNVVYTAGHTHDCGMINYNPEQTPRVEQRAMAFDKRGSATGRYNAFGPVFDWAPFAGRPSTDALYWWPQFSTGTVTGSYQAGWTVETNGQYVVYGGEFPRVNGVNQQGLVRFAVRTTAPNAEGPQGVAQISPTVTAVGPGVARVAWTAPYDLDNRRLRYEVLRGLTVANSTVISDFQADSKQWTRTPMGFLDETAPPGTTQTYRVRVRDAFGNGGVSGASTVSVPAGTRASSAYLDSVQANGATNFWRLNESGGTVARDSMRSNDLNLLADAQRGVPGSLVDEADTATTFPASELTNTVRGTTSFWQEGPQTFSVEAWFRTTSTQGGKIVGFGSSSTGRSNSNLTDRHIYLTNNGEVRFGLRPDYAARRTIASPAGLNDGQWHHVVATLDGSGARLYVDGGLSAQDATLTKAQVYYGYWRIGGDRLTQWPSAPTREAFEGTIDEVALYPTALTGGQVSANYAASGRTGEPNVVPVAAFDSEADDLDVTFDASGSSDPDGTIAAYAWNFDDGSPTGSGSSPTHTFPAAGTYDVTLTVTDNRGATTSVTQPVTVVAPPNQPPTAAFTFTTDDLTVAVDGSTSSDPEGTVATYAWDFDGEDSGTGATASHTFASPGTKQVTVDV